MGCRCQITSPHIEADPHDGHPWYSDIKRHLESQAFPKDATANDRRTLRRLAAQYVINGGILYKRSFSPGIHRGSRALTVGATRSEQARSEQAASGTGKALYIVGQEGKRRQ